MSANDEGNVPATHEPTEGTIAAVKLAVQSNCEASWIAEQIGISLDEYLSIYEPYIADALNDFQLELMKVMRAKALGKPHKGDARSAAWLLDRLGYNPAETRMLGAKNQKRPLVITGETKGVPKAAISQGIADAIATEVKD